MVLIFKLVPIVTTVFVLVIAPAQVQDPALGLVERHEVCMDKLLSIT